MPGGRAAPQADRADDTCPAADTAPVADTAPDADAVPNSGRPVEGAGPGPADRMAKPGREVPPSLTYA